MLTVILPNLKTRVFLFCFVFLKKELEEQGGENPLMRTVFQLYLGYLRSPQSEILQKHVFGSWRAFIKKVCRIDEV